MAKQCIPEPNSIWKLQQYLFPGDSAFRVQDFRHRKVLAKCGSKTVKRTSFM
jgi:hypothetical protein